MHKLLWAAILIVFVLTACGGQANPTTTTINASLDEYRITPAETRIPAGQEITLTLSNIGKKAHAWVLLKDPPTEPYSADDEANLLFQVTVPAGGSQTVTFKAPAAPGEYSVTSSLPGDLEGGMLARIVVVQPGY